MKRKALGEPAGLQASPHDPTPAVVKHVVEALALVEDDLLVDLRCGDGNFAEEILRHVRLTWQIIAVEASPDQVVEGALSADIRPVTMGAETFVRFPIRYHKALLRDGFSALQGQEGALERIFHQIIPGGRLLVVEEIPTPELPLPAAALERWQAERVAVEEIERLLARAGFATQSQTVDCECRALGAQCAGWVEKRAWPILADFSDEALARDVDELRRRYADGEEVEWTARYDLVTGIKRRGA